MQNISKIECGILNIQFSENQLYCGGTEVWAFCIPYTFHVTSCKGCSHNHARARTHTHTHTHTHQFYSDFYMEMIIGQWRFRIVFAHIAHEFHITSYIWISHYMLHILIICSIICSYYILNITCCIYILYVHITFWIYISYVHITWWIYILHVHITCS